MQLIDGIPVFGVPDPGAVAQIKTCAKTATYTAPSTLPRGTNCGSEESCSANLPLPL
jgi:hypothetical protein